MKADDYKHVVSASGEPPLAENIILDGNIMPLRNDPKDKIKLRGEDICFLFEAGARFDRVGFGAASVREFTRKLKASQAQAALDEITQMFQSGYALKSLPKEGGIFVLGNQYDYMEPFDVLMLDDCEPMEPVPEVGGKILAAPLQAAFENFKKIKGRVVSTESVPATHPTERIVFAQKTLTPMYSGDGQTIYFENIGIGPINPNIPGEDVPTYYKGIETPVAEGGEFLPPGAVSGYLDGVRCLSGTLWDVSMERYDYNDPWVIEQQVLKLDTRWIGPTGGHFSRFECSPSSAMGILESLCSAISPSKWAEANGDYTNMSKGQFAWFIIRAKALDRIGIADVDECLKEGFVF